MPAFAGMTIEYAVWTPLRLRYFPATVMPSMTSVGASVP
jgi:hypothetical protein